jgi:hypothetical protein
MAITDTGLPAIDPHTMLSTLLTANMASPGDNWTPVVNAKWLEFKKQKTYQIAITGLYQETETANLTGGTATAMPTISTAVYQITLYHPNRAKHWNLFRKIMLVLNNETLTSPAAGISDYHWVRILGTTDGRGIDLNEDMAGIDRPANATTGYQSEIEVKIRWNE